MIGEQWQLRLDAGYGPACLITVAGKALQGSSVGQPFAGAGIQPGAKAQVIDRHEGLQLARSFDAPCIFFAKAAHQA